MKSVIDKIFSDDVDDKVHQYFVRYGKGDYKRRFLLRLSKGKKVKIRGSFEWANDFVEFVREIKDVKYSGLIISKEKIPGKEGKKKSGAFAYEIEDSSLEGFEEAYWYLLDVSDDEIVLKTKKKLPKPGKSVHKIDDKFCSLDLDLKYWEKAKAAFFSDVPECKKVMIEHDLLITDIEMPAGVSDPVEIRKLAKRKGVIKRKIIIDEEETVREKAFSV